MDTPSLDESTTKEILRQVEFYFSDSNIPRDTFLRNRIRDSEDGLVSLALICSFKKMRGHLKLGELKQEEISEDVLSLVAAVLRQSSSLKVSEDGKRVGRITSFLDATEAIEQQDLRTIAASPMRFDVTWEDVQSFFSQHATVNCVRLPRHLTDKRVFCGTALIEFASSEEAEKVMTQSLVFDGTELEMLPKKQFDIERVSELKSQGSSASVDKKGVSNSDPIYPKGLIVSFTLKNTRDGVLGEQSGADESAAVVTPVTENVKSTDGVENESEQEAATVLSGEGNDERAKEAKVCEENGGKQEEAELEKADVAADTADQNADAQESGRNGISREDLKAVFGKFGPVKYVDFKKGDLKGYIRFEKPEAAQKARVAATIAEEGGLIVKNIIATLEPVTGEAEKGYWTMLRSNQDQFRTNKSNHGRGRRHDFKRKNKRDGARENDSCRSNKAQKVET